MEDTVSVRPSVCFDVQKIIGVSIGNGNAKNYQVQWAPTWVSGFHLVGCEHLIEAFLQQQSEKCQSVDDTTSTSVPETLVVQNDINEDVLRDDDEPEFAAWQQSTYDVTELTYGQHSQEDMNNSCLYSNTSNDNVNVKVGTNMETNVSNEEMYTRGMGASNQTNPNFEWVKVENMHNNDDTQEVNSMHSTLLYFVDNVDNDDSTVSAGGEEHHEQPNLLVPDNEYENNILEVKREEVMSEVETERGRISLSNENPINLGEGMSQPTVEMVHKCVICNITFKQKYHLTRHLLVHTGERPYQCEECSKSFARKDYLMKHIKVHMGDRPYKCINCSKTFKQKYHLTEHLRLHTGEKPFKCNVCNRSFAHKSNFNKHCRLHMG